LFGLRATPRAYARAKAIFRELAQIT